MDRDEAALHYIEHAVDALDVVLNRCAVTYGPTATEQVSRMFTNLLLIENLVNYCDIGEVFSLWGVVSRTPISDRVYGAEFIIALNQQFSLFVDPPVAPKSPARRAGEDSLNPLGRHLVQTIAGCHHQGTEPDVGVHPEIASYRAFMHDVPTEVGVAGILTNFPWMAPLYLLSLSHPVTLTNILNAWMPRGAPAETGGDGQ